MLNWGSLKKGEKIDIGLVYGGALIIGIGSILFRAQTVGAVDLELIRLQYGVTFVFLGSLLLLRARARTPSGIFLTTGLSVALLIGLLVPAQGIELLDVVSYLLLGGLVFVGGMLHYRLNRPTNAQALILAGALGTEMYLFGVYYCVESFRTGGSIWFAGGAVILTVILVGYLRVLRRELNNSYSDLSDILG